MNDKSKILQVEASMDAMRRALRGARESLREGLKLTRTQIEILMSLDDRPQNTGELAKQLLLTQSAITQTVETLVRRELVERYASEHDRRITQLQLSSAGQALTAQLRELRLEYMQELVSRLTEEETEALISITQKLTAVLQATETRTKNKMEAKDVT